MTTIKSIEEKAKRYDKAIERAKNYYSTTDSASDIKLIGLIFPELKESEDERIRKALVEMMHNTTGDSLWIDYNVHKEDALAWLEKQGEQKPAGWSEENENRINRLIAYFEDEESFTAEDDIVYANWLKSLRPQSQWMPSDEQMNALNYVVNLMASSERPTENDLYYNILKSLRQQLMKLKE